MFPVYRLVRLVARAPVCQAEVVGSKPGRNNNTQGLQVTEKKVLPL